MAKRFTDTEKWRDPWFCQLTSQEKLFWIYILDTCSMSGIWQVNWPLVKFYIPDFEYKEDVFCGRIEKLKDNKWYIKKFTSFQYGELSGTNRMHQRIHFELEKEGVSIPLKECVNTLKELDKDKESLSLKSLRGESLREGFEKFWLCYPKRRSRGDALKAWRKLNPTDEQVSRILAAVTRAKTSEDWVKNGGQYIPHPASWLNSQGWEDEIKDAEEEKRERLRQELERRRALNAKTDAIAASYGQDRV